MAYTVLTDAEIAVGGPIQNPTLAKLQGNDAYFNTQIASMSSGLQNPRPLTFVVKGDYYSFSAPMTGMAYERIWQPITLTAGQVWVTTAGASGTLQVDVLYKRGGGGWTSLFSVKPSLAYGVGDLATSSNGVLSTTALLAGDFLRLDIITVQVGNPEFQVVLPYYLT